MRFRADDDAPRADSDDTGTSNQKPKILNPQVLLRNEETVEKLSSLMLCGRSYACAQAVGVPLGEHVPTLQPVVHPPKERVR